MPWGSESMWGNCSRRVKEMHILWLASVHTLWWNVQDQEMIQLLHLLNHPSLQQRHFVQGEQLNMISFCQAHTHTSRGFYIFKELPPTESLKTGKPVASNLYRIHPNLPDTRRHYLKRTDVPVKWLKKCPQMVQTMACCLLLHLHRISLW